MHGNEKSSIKVDSNSIELDCDSLIVTNGFMGFNVSVNIVHFRLWENLIQRICFEK